MAKYIKLFIVALFASASFSLTSCSSDDDESEGFTNVSDIAFTLNDQPYYWEGNIYDIPFYDPSSNWGDFYVGTDYKGDKYIAASASAFSEQPQGGEYSENVSSAYISFAFKYFDWKSAKAGQNIDFSIRFRDSDQTWLGCHIDLFSPYSNTSQYYGWINNDGVKGTAKFISFKNDVLTIEFSNVMMTNDDFHKYGDVDDSRIPTTLTLNGQVPFVYDED